MGVGCNGMVCMGVVGCGDVVGKGGCGVDLRSVSIMVGGIGGVEMGVGKVCICVVSYSKFRCVVSISRVGCVLCSRVVLGIVCCGERGRDDSMIFVVLCGFVLKKVGV